MINWLIKTFKRRYVGTLGSESNITKGGEFQYKMYGSYVLTESFWGRKVKQIGDAGGSQFAIERRAAVFAWKAGGPKPQGLEIGYAEPWPQHSPPNLNVVPFKKT